MTTTHVSHYLTPTLWVGSVPPNVPGCVPVKSVKAAIEVIEAGKVAVLPRGHWAQARKVLRTLGASPETVEDREHFAKTGSTLHEV